MSILFSTWSEDEDSAQPEESSAPIQESTLPLIDFSKYTRKKEKKLDLNPSSADRWATCTESPRFIYDNWDLIPPETDTVYNTEGTTAHEVGAALLQGRQPNEKDKRACPVPINAEMRWHAWKYAEYVNGLKQSIHSRVLVEQKIPLWYMPGRNAIVDAAVINPCSLDVIDYKYGEGVIVSTEKNRQAVIYAYSIGRDLNLSNDHRIYIHIYQPRGRAAEDSPFHVWETTWGEISDLAAEIELKSMYILRPVNHHNLVFAPSDKACQWCPAKGFCKERTRDLAKHFSPLGDINSQVYELPTGKAMTPNQLASVLIYGDQLKKWVDDAQDYALAIMKHGVKIPGHKLVLSRGGNRYWSNPNRAAKILTSTTILKEDEVYERKLLGPAAVEKLLGKGKFNTELTNLISKPLGQPVIAPEDDKRPTCLADAAKEFSNLNTESKVNLDQF